MLPSAEALHLRRFRKNLFGAFCEQDLEGNRNPQGGGAEAEGRAAAGRMKKPRSGTRTKAGYETADTLQNKFFKGALAAECNRDRRSLQAGMSVARRVVLATSVATWSAFVRQAHCAQGHVGQTSRIGSRNGHRLVSGIL